MFDVLDLKSAHIENKRVLIRVDLNVPIISEMVSSDQRIMAILPTIEYCVSQKAKVLLMSHLGRPKEGEYQAKFSLRPVAKCLQDRLGIEVALVKDWEKLESSEIELAEDKIYLFENVRFNLGETSNDKGLGQRLARCCDVFVMDAFGTAHRAHASTHAIVNYAPVACAGPLLMKELNALRKVFSNPKRPLLAVVGGAKVSTKLEVLLSLSDKVDGLITGGGIANTFMLAQKQKIGRSICEVSLVGVAQKLVQTMHQRGADIPMVEDVVVAKKLDKNVESTTKKVSEIEESDYIFDLGPKTIDRLCALIEHAGTIVWNGPIGVFEHDQFSHGTKKITKAIADSSAFSVAGGGDTLAAIEQFGAIDKISYISTGGGAFLEFLEGKVLPSVAVLQEHKLKK